MMEDTEMNSLEKVIATFLLMKQTYFVAYDAHEIYAAGYNHTPPRRCVHG